ncbi:bacteriohemerythrin [Noviherbaspirillum denitrificans]|uniref:Hemerythrin-like domain-containing protein n=1 Tax=Noviherbaspirillum denitrificans TaxID=1968433 RepID=A0A254TDR9_9BURK|nr:bacteriohemerythrin [Noviherbaspirillum denitrificans]OWW20307.1 hypothetical protein AYR66_13200 [Noviherbaspirillum denitrificans]
MKKDVFLSREDEDISRCFDWKEDMRCGDPDIDADHQHIFELAQHLRSVSIRGRERIVVGKALIDLMDYAHSHFQREEALMQSSAYPMLEEHRMEHAALLELIHELHRDFMDGKAIGRADVWRLLSRWVQHHVLSTDRALVLFVRQSR